MDSPRLRQRVKVANTLSCAVDGNYGIYRTRVVLTPSGKGKNAVCTCPSEYWPCKHAHALVLTYQKCPDSFVDVDRLLTGLKQKGRDKLLRLIRDMVAASPACLKALGIKGFELEDEEEPYGESW